MAESPYPGHWETDDQGNRTKFVLDPVHDGEWIEPTPQIGHFIKCCDCGLEHIMDFRIKNGKVQFRAYRREISHGT